jgi:polysaccharide deacetylase family protein (PEP-CTERM system associated)
MNRITAMNMDRGKIHNLPVMKNILTVDLEDWFSVEIFTAVFNHGAWEELKSMIEPNTEKILGMFRSRRVKATFFVLGWVADRYPDLIARVAEEGHEIACHSYYHRMVCSLTPEEFKKDTDMAIEAVVNACGRVPSGYRSPSWGMKGDMTWAYEILKEKGFSYDSSIFPIRHDIYGDPGAPREIYRVTLPSGGSIMEIPASTVIIFGRRFPIGGGGWLRQFPYWFTRWSIRRLNREDIPVVVYFHPWELDTEIPRLKLDLKNRIRQYGSLNTMETKVKNLLRDFDFVPIRDYIKSLNVQQDHESL